MKSGETEEVGASLTTAKTSRELQIILNPVLTSSQTGPESWSKPQHKHLRVDLKWGGRSNPEQPTHQEEPLNPKATNATTRSFNRRTEDPWGEVGEAEQTRVEVFEVMRWEGGGGGEAGVLQQQFDWWLQEEWTLVKDWCTVHYAFRASTGSLTMLTMLKTVFGGSVVDSSWTLLRWLTAVIRSVAEDEDNIQKTWRCGKLECLQRLPAAAAEEAHIAKMCSVLCIH